jgi:choice-of-anchor C domain-containing protein
MKIQKHRLLISSFLAIAAVTLCTSRLTHGAALINGDFEQPSIGAQQFQTITATSSLITGWQVTSGEVDIVSNSLWPAFTGTQSIDLVGVSTGTIEQDFATTPGMSYELTLRYSSNPFAPSFLYSATVSITGASQLFSQTVNHTGASVLNMNYQPLSSTFVANSAQTTVRFAALNGNGNGGIIVDTVAVNIVPEPFTLTFVLCGSTLIFLRRNRRCHA